MFKKEQGSDHWKMQRLTAVTLVPLSLWFLGSLLVYSPSYYTDVIEWFKSPFSATAMVLFISLLLYHAHLGIEVVINDYIHHALLKLILKYVLAASSIALFVFAFFCILKIHFHPL